MNEETTPGALGSNDQLGQLPAKHDIVDRLRDCQSMAGTGLLEAADEIERLRADLISCRGTVKTELNHYERQAMVHGKTPHGATYEAEAQRLAALLDRIDGLMRPNAAITGRSRSGA